MTNTTATPSKTNKTSNSVTTSQHLPLTLSDDLNDFTDMSLKNRIYGFSFCLILGVFFSALAYSAMSTGKLKTFSILYGLTNLIFISGTGFIVGPVRQFKLMFTAERIMSSLIYLAATIAVILTAIRGKMTLAMILFFVQIISLIWYTISYIPYAQEIVSKIVGI